MCGACEDEVFLTTPNPHCVLRGLSPAPAGVPPRSRFAATAVDDDAPPRPPAVALPPLLSLSRGRTASSQAARS